MEIKNECYLEHDGQKVLARLENWNDDYEFFEPFDRVVAYPISKKTVGYGYIKEGRKFRLSLDFDNEQESKKALDNLINSEKTFTDYIRHIEPKLRACLIAP